MTVTLWPKYWSMICHKKNMPKIEIVNKWKECLAWCQKHDILIPLPDIDDEIEWFLAKLERRAPGAGQKSSPIERKAIPKSKKETQSFHKIRTTSKLSNLVYRAPAKAGLISKTDKKDAPNPKNEKLLSLSAQSESQSTKSDRRTVDNHRVVNAKEKEDMLKFLNEKLSQKRAKSDGRLKNPSVKELSEARLVRNGEYCNGRLGNVLMAPYHEEAMTLERFRHYWLFLRKYSSNRWFSLTKDQ